jgi:multimeric flavodoxin WrbA
MSKSILFLCGSPRGTASASRKTAQYMARFLDYDYEFVDVGRAKLSSDPTEAEPAYQAIVAKMRAADAIVWVFGAWFLFVPLDLQYLFDKLFTQREPDLRDKLAASVMTSARVHDDLILERTQFVSEQLGMRYLGDVSAAGSPMIGYCDDEETTEDSCRVLAQRIDRALADGFKPARKHLPVDLALLSSASRGEGFQADWPQADKTGDRTILIVTGLPLAESPAAKSTVEAIARTSKNKVEVLELADHKVGRCIGCYLCDFRVEGVCVVKDDYEAVKARLHKADAIVLIGVSSCGLVDSKLKALLDRSWGIAHRPTLEGRYGFAVAVGGGAMDSESALYLVGAQRAWGVKSIAGLGQGPDPDAFAGTLRQTVEDLDRALDERWQVALRFSSIGAHLVFRDLITNSGMALRADYKYWKDKGFLRRPSTGGMNAVMRFAFRSERMGNALMKSLKAQTLRKRDARLSAYVSAGGKLGGGKDRGSTVSASPT